MFPSHFSMARQIVLASSAFHKESTGHAPTGVSVVMSDNTLMITLQDALSPAEGTLARSQAGAAKGQEFHRRFFSSAAPSLRREIKRITGVEVREAVVEVEPSTGTVVHAFNTGAVVQLFLLAGDAPSETWSGSGSPASS